MRSADSWFSEYSENHRNATNIAIHWVCVPAIFFSVIGLLGSIPPDRLPWLGQVPWAKVAVALALAFFYVRLSVGIAVGMAIAGYACLVVVRWLDWHAPWPLWAISLMIFAAAWVGQFYGHKVEGKKPSFLKDLAFLLVGPAWLLAKTYKRIGIPY
ncbi:MAG: Mpo1-like protein [Flavobacteriales bacterium]